MPEAPSAVRYNPQEWVSSLILWCFNGKQMSYLFCGIGWAEKRTIYLIHFKLHEYFSGFVWWGQIEDGSNRGWDKKLSEDTDPGHWDCSTLSILNCSCLLSKRKKRQKTSKTMKDHCPDSLDETDLWPFLVHDPFLCSKVLAVPHTNWIKSELSISQAWLPN